MIIRKRSRMGVWYTCSVVRGYVRAYFNFHPLYPKRKWIEEHRLIISELVGRALKRFEVVHHKNHNRIDNHPRNLDLMYRGDHGYLHNTGLKRSTKFIRNISKKNLGKVRSEQHKANYRASWTPERRAAASNYARTSRGHTHLGNYTKSVFCKAKQTHKHLGHYSERST